MSDIVERGHFPLLLLVAKNVDRGVGDTIRWGLSHIKPQNMPDKYINRRAMTHPQDGCLGVLICPVLHLRHHTCLRLYLRLSSLRHMSCRMGPDGGEMGVEVLYHVIDPVADVPFAQSRTWLYWTVLRARSEL